MKTFLERTSRALLATILLCPPTVHSEDDPGEAALESGPAAGTKLTPVTCYATDGPLSGKEFDAAAKLGESPSALLFIHELTRNTAPVLRGLDNLATEFAVLGFKSFTIMLTGDRTAGERQLGRVNGSLRLGNPIVLSTDGAEGPGNYALNRKAALTLVFAKNGEVMKSLALTDTGPNDLPVIRKEVEALTGKVPEEPAELRQLIAAQLPPDPEALKQLAADQALELRRLRIELRNLRERSRRPGMQRQPPARGKAEERPAGDPDNLPVKREGKPPEDPELNTLLRSFIRQTNDESRADEIFADIKTRAAETDKLTAETIEMFKLMLSFRDRYGTKHAQGLAESFLKEQAPAAKQE